MNTQKYLFIERAYLDPPLSTIDRYQSIHISKAELVWPLFERFCWVSEVTFAINKNTYNSHDITVFSMHLTEYKAWSSGDVLIE